MLAECTDLSCFDTDLPLKLRMNTREFDVRHCHLDGERLLTFSRPKYGMDRQVERGWGSRFWVEVHFSGANENEVLHEGNSLKAARELYEVTRRAWGEVE